MKILITGFDPFNGESVNPALEAVKLMKEEIAGAKIVKLEIPTVFCKSVEKVYEAMKAEQPDVVLSIGQAGGRFGVTPERSRSMWMMRAFRITRVISRWIRRFLLTANQLIFRICL